MVLATVMFARRCHGCTNLPIGLEDAACALFRCSPSGARCALLHAIWMRENWHACAASVSWTGDYFESRRRGGKDIVTVRKVVMDSLLELDRTLGSV
jgi:hypothetical protein